MKEIGNLFKETREKKSLSIEDVYKKTLIHPGLLRDIEAGKAEGSLNKIYVKAFLKKYAAFLGLDIGSQLEERYKPEPAAEEHKSKLYAGKEIITLKTNNYLSLILSVVVGLIFIFFVFSGVSKVKSFLAHQAARKTKVSAVKTALSAPKVNKEAAPKEAESKAQPETPVKLSIRTTDAVWLHVKKDGETVFNGTMPKGSRESWTGKKGFDIRAGKLEAVDITLNNKNLGKIGSGAKNITVDKDGVHIAKSK